MRRKKNPLNNRNVRRAKKLRGWRVKKMLADFHREKCPPITVSDITAEGFWLHTPKKDYYISRKVFPWFRDATDKEIRDVGITLDADEFHGDYLCWRKLDFDTGTNSLEDTDWIASKNIYVRGVHRPDLRD